MGANLDRRELLKLAVLFVAATRFGRSFAMDAAPEPPVAGSNSPGVRSLSGVRYALPALAKQKAEMKRQTLELLGSVRKVNGYMEIGTTGRYVGELQYDVELKGDVVLVHSVAPSYSLTDVAERGQLGKIGRFVSLNDYAPILPSDVAEIGRA